MKGKVKKSLLLVTAFCATALVGFGAANANSATVSVFAEETNTETSFQVASAALRVPDDTYGEGIRFKLTMSKTDYETNGIAEKTTGVLLIPDVLFEGDELNLESSNTEIKNVAGITWKAEDDIMATYIHVYDIAEEYYTTDILIRGYISDSKSTIYTDSKTASVASVAVEASKSATEADKATLQESYLTYAVNYHEDGDSVSSTGTGVYGQKITAPDAPEKTGYTFAGWWNKAYDTEWKFDETTISGAVTNLYAKWTANTDTKYVVKHLQQNLADDGYTEVIEDREEKTGTTAELTAAQAKEYTGFESGVFKQTTIAADGSTVVEIKYARTKYTVRFDVDGGENITDQMVKYATPASELANITTTKSGCTFKGWTLENGTEIPEHATVTENITVKAKWYTNQTKMVSDIDFETQKGSVSVDLSTYVPADIVISEVTGITNDGTKLTISEAAMSDCELAKSKTITIECTSDNEKTVTELSLVITKVTYAIRSEADLYTFVSLVSGSQWTDNAIREGYYVLCNDIDCSDTSVETITGQFRATLDGRGYTINNLHTTNLFAMLYRGTIKNIIFTKFSGNLVNEFHSNAMLENVYISFVAAKCVTVWENGGGSKIKNVVVEFLDAAGNASRYVQVANVTYEGYYVINGRVYGSSAEGIAPTMTNCGTFTTWDSYLAAETTTDTSWSTEFQNAVATARSVG